ncbi:uncharacterized protein KY384_005956 [Bacidia gigantensis]|uniref:uncharacterized protein n=1 Tax=Bacidia gigantensis TaxID=2732470 RepID=UPI001D04ADEC|nr:uncharacterized protein KY384_005956 [Bacidia gigantensis]KAG8529320.1 hypothetical protein KY384_005956 [Bacidia gigantensis]
MATSTKQLCGVVISSGKMMRAIKVRTSKQVYNSFLKKHFVNYDNHLVSDPTEATRTGDVVRITTEGQVSRHIRHVVTEIVAPWGSEIHERPAVLSGQQRKAVKDEKYRAKLERRGKVAQLERWEREREKTGKDAPDYERRGEDAAELVKG